jgi:hypothetical protein
VDSKVRSGIRVLGVIAAWGLLIAFIWPQILVAFDLIRGT